MNKKFFIFLIALLLVPLNYTGLGNNTNVVRAETTSSKYTVTFSEGTSQQDAEAVLQGSGVTLEKYLSGISIAFISSNDEGQINTLKASANVVGVTTPTSISDAFGSNIVEAAFPTTDPLYQFQWNVRRIGANKAWDRGVTGSHNTIVGIIDSAVAHNHPDLSANVIIKKCFSQNQPCTTYPTFPGSAGNHGTITAGVIAAASNGIGIIGVAPNIGIASYNIAELGSNGIAVAYDESIWEAIYEAAEDGVDVLNLSATFAIPYPISEANQLRLTNWRRALNWAKAKGVTFVSNAGNSRYDLDSNSSIIVPCELEGVICAGATNIRPQPVFPQEGFYEEKTFYTGYGKNNIDLVAPGGDCGPNSNCFTTPPDTRYFILTTGFVFNSTCGQTESCAPTYTASIGTSFSTPEIAAAAGLIIDSYNTKNGHKPTPAQVLNILKHTADPLPNYPELGAGVLNVDAAVNYVLTH